MGPATPTTSPAQATGASGDVALWNRGRLYLDSGSIPAYVTSECDSVLDLIAYDKAGERILEELLVDAGLRLGEEGIAEFAADAQGEYERRRG